MDDIALTILIVAYEPGERLLRTLESIVSQSRRPDILIQDGGSTDGSYERAAQYLRDAGYSVSSYIEGAPAPQVRSGGAGGTAILWQGRDDGIYDAMNRALAHAADAYPAAGGGRYILFLGCGDRLSDTHVAEAVAQAIVRDRSGEKEPGPAIYYGDVLEKLTGQRVSSDPRLNDYSLYRNVPCHQACVYDAGLLYAEPFDTRYRVRADYEQFLRLVRRAGARTVYTGLLIAEYEGGGFSETSEHLRLSEQEHRQIIHMYMSDRQIMRFDIYRALTLAPLRTRLARSPLTSGMYNRFKTIIYKYLRKG